MRFSIITMKRLLIPSVVEFDLKDKEVDFLAKELFGIIRNKKSRFETVSKSRYLDGSNDYLNYQFKRLRIYAERGEITKFDFLATRLLKNSKVFLVYALNHVYPNYTSMNQVKVIKLLQRVMAMAQTEDNDFLYERVWIDKKEGDKGRPLGVPFPEDRIYGHMMTRIMEAYLFGTGQYSKNQHGGTPGRGVLTFLKKLAQKFGKHSAIYEFDIKGYFDHISHKSIMEMFRSKTINSYLIGALNANPTSYKACSFPFDEEKIAVYEEEDWGDWNYVEDTKEMIREMMAGTSAEEQAIFLEETLARMNQVPHPGLSSAEWTPDDMLRVERILNPGKRIDFDNPLNHFTSLEDNYKNLMEGGTVEPNPLDFFNLQGRKPATPKDHFIGRDNWKDLRLAGKGVPQGSSMGPVLSSVLLGKIMPKNSLLYMDDGIVFLKDQDNRSSEELNNAFDKRVKQIGCEISRTKSGLLDTQKLVSDGLKIVGTRWKQVRTVFNSAYKVSSETRAGIIKPLFEIPREDSIKLIEALYLKGRITVSKHRVLKWYLRRGQLDFIGNSELFKLCDQIGILGAILSRAYSPTVSLEEMKEQIEYGKFRAEMKILESRGSLGERILGGIKNIALETTEEKIYVKPTIYNLRTICNEVLLKYLKGELPEKRLKVQGMRKEFVLNQMLIQKLSASRKKVRADSLTNSE